MKALLLLAALASAQDPAPAPVFAGIGAVLKEEQGAFVVQSLLAGGPADKDGRLKPGDRVEAVAQGDHALLEAKGLSLEQAVCLLRGKPATIVRIRVSRLVPGGKAEAMTLSLVRQAIAVPPPSAAPAPPPEPGVPALPPAKPLSPDERRKMEDQL